MAAHRNIVKFTAIPNNKHQVEPKCIWMRWRYLLT